MTAFAPFGGGYGSGHPWYYRLGGRILYPGEIKAEIYDRSPDEWHLQGFASIARMAEPARSREIQKQRKIITDGLQDDITRYRELARQINKLRTFIGPAPKPTFLESQNEPNSGISLKHNHIHYGFSKLRALDSLDVQQDLFSFI